MQTKKILISLSYYHPNISGLTKYAKILAEELAKENDVTVITSKYLKKLAGEEKINRVLIKRISGFQINKWFYMPFFTIQSIKEIRKCDTLLLHLPSIENGFLAMVGKIFGKKVISTYHCKVKSGNKIVDEILKKWQDITVFFSDKVVVNTIDYLDGYHLIENQRKKVIEIFPPIIVKKTKQRYNFGNKKIIGYLGRISREKNIELLIRVAKKMGNKYLFILAGPDNTIGEGKYIEKIKKTAMNVKNIKIIGEIESPEKFYNSIDCLVLPSNNELESFGMVSAEAIRCGCPVVTSDKPGIRKPVQISGFGDTFIDNNSSDLERKIRKIIEKKPIAKINLYNLFKPEKFIADYKKLF